MTHSVGRVRDRKVKCAPMRKFHCTVKRSKYDVKYGLPALGDDMELTVAVEGSN